MVSELGFLLLLPQPMHLFAQPAMGRPQAQDQSAEPCKLKRSLHEDLNEFEFRCQLEQTVQEQHVAQQAPTRMHETGYETAHQMEPDKRPGQLNE